MKARLLVFGLTSLVILGCKVNEPEAVSGYLPNVVYSVPKIDNIPDTNKLTQLSAVVFGEDVQSYVYKVGPKDSVRCRNPEGYSAEVSGDSWITDDISAMPDGWLRLCVRSKNSAGNFTPYPIAAEKVWLKDMSPAVTVSITTANVHGLEQNQTVPVTFQLSGTKPYDVVLQLSLTGTLSSGTDYLLGSGGATSVTIPAGQTTATLPLYLYDDSTPEENESLSIGISSTNSDSVTFEAQIEMRIDVIDNDRIEIRPSQIVAGQYFACGLFAGDILCWGSNAAGQLGDGTTTDSPSSPVLASPGLHYQSIAAGHSHACGVTIAGDLMCWGSNTYGQLGNGTTTDSLIPVAVDSGTKYKSVSAAGLSNCALTASGNVKCWGNNASGNLGDGSTTNRTSPVPIDGATTYASISAANTHTCGILTTGYLKCWGLGSSGQLGTGTTANHFTPFAIDGGTQYKQIRTMGFVTCGISASDSLRCWGSNSYGQIGDGTTVNKLSPTVIDSGAAYKSLPDPSPLPLGTTCAITDQNELKCWGRSADGQLKDGTIIDSLTPKIVDSGTEYSLVAVSYSGVCGLTTNGALLCWGGLSSPNPPAYSPQLVSPFKKYKKIVLGSEVACAILESDDLECWGTNYNGRIGDGGSSGWRYNPVRIDPGVKYKSISVFEKHTCGVTLGGVAKCWGYNLAGEIGDGTTTDAYLPLIVDAGTKYSQITVSRFSTCGTTESGNKMCWGFNSGGLYGNGTTTPSLVPVNTESGQIYTKVITSEAAGVFSGYTCGITDSGELKCSGSNIYGGLGDGTTTAKLSPISPDPSNTYKDISLTGGRTCAITTEGVLKCWGRNNFGQLGDGTTTNSSSPAIIDSGTTYKQLNSGSHNTAYHSCAIVSGSQQLKCWGLNNFGQIGNGTTTDVSVPTLIDSSTSYKYVSVGVGSTCAITTAGLLKCWGASMFDLIPSYLKQNVFDAITPADSSMTYITAPIITPNAGAQFDVAISFYGDSNHNSVADLYYCNQTDSPNCDPLAGSQVSLTRNSNTFSASVGPLSSPNDSGDVLKIVIIPSDPDGNYGYYATTTTLN